MILKNVEITKTNSEIASAIFSMQHLKGIYNYLNVYVVTKLSKKDLRRLKEAIC